MREIKRGNVMAFGPDTNNDLSLKGSLMRQWPGEKVSPPSPAPDAADYEIFAKEQKEKHKEQTFEDHQRSLAAADTGDTNKLAGRIAHGVMAGAVDLRSSAKQEEKKREEAFKDLVLREQLRRIEADLAYYRERIRLLQGYQDALQHHIEKLRNGEKIEKNADGSLKDKQAEEAIRSHEQRYKTRIDRDDPAQVEEVLRKTGEDLEQNIKSYTEVVKDAKRAGVMSSEDASRTYEEIGINKGKNSAIEILSEIEDEHGKIEIGTSRNLEKNNIDAMKDDLFIDAPLGKTNPFAKGEMKTAFTEATDSAKEAPSTQPHLIPRTPGMSGQG